MMSKNEYLKIVNKLERTRYYNIKRSGTIVCRTCNIHSKIPLLHVLHVKEVHPNLDELCPYCQEKCIVGPEGRVSRESKTHLKFCCFLHKTENIRYRRLLTSVRGKSEEQNNNNKINQINRSVTVKTSMLTLQPFINNNKFLVNVFQFNTKNNSNDNNNQYPYYNKTEDENKNFNDEHHHHKTNDNNNNTIEHHHHTNETNNKYIEEIATVKKFHENYVIHDKTPLPSWLCSEPNNNNNNNDIDNFVSRNTLMFDPKENIDCRLIRILSQDWSQYRVFKYTVKYLDFLENVEKFKKCLKDNFFIITRYIHMFKSKTDTDDDDDDDDDLRVSLVVIGPRKRFYSFWHCLITIAAHIFEITNLDVLVDVFCYMSNDNATPLQFPKNDSFQILNLKYDQDVLQSDRYEGTINVCTNLDKSEPKVGFNKFFSPLGRYAKIYFYSQTRYGCIRAFDRLLHRNNLSNYITNVIHDKDGFYINYSTLDMMGGLDDKDYNHFEINLCPDEIFATESYYQNINGGGGGGSVGDLQYYVTDKDYKFFFIDSHHLKIVISRSSDSSKETETTKFPECLKATNIRYKLTTVQENIYKVTQYHREKLLLETNNIPQIFL